MILNTNELKAAIGYLTSMELGLAELRRSVPMTDARLALLAEPYIDAIRKTRAEIDAYLEIPPAPKVDTDEIRRLVSSYHPCDRCGELVRQVITGEVPRISVSLTESDAAKLAIEATDEVVRRRLLCALSLLDPELAAGLREAMATRPLDDDPLPTLEQRQAHACKICGAIPDDAGERTHSRGCYQLSADGGGTDYPL